MDGTRKLNILGCGPMIGSWECPERGCGFTIVVKENPSLPAEGGAFVVLSSAMEYPATFRSREGADDAFYGLCREHRESVHGHKGES